uniref:Uncharacterized protein n=1 Tax=Pyxicephalus adspersus TaxID=30357 RepID=A0AAV3AYE9_PYXAD|nr:TPA: hypothetical protein GDO54_000222 [Pyxicephalus adspersus]
MLNLTLNRCLAQKTYSTKFFLFSRQKRIEKFAQVVWSYLFLMDGLVFSTGVSVHLPLDSKSSADMDTLLALLSNITSICR